MTLNSAVVDAGDNGTHDQYNNLRKDVLQEAGNYVVATGSNNAFVINIDDNVDGSNNGEQINSIGAGWLFKWKANHSLVNVGSNAPTLTVRKASDSSTLLATKSLKKLINGSLLDGDIKQDQIVVCFYDGTNMQVINTLTTKHAKGGDGSDGNLSITSGTTNINLNQIYEYKTIDIGASGTLSTASSNGLMWIKCKGDCNIAGTINLQGKGGPGGAQNTSGAGDPGSNGYNTSSFDASNHFGGAGQAGSEDSSGGGGGGSISAGTGGAASSSASGSSGGTALTASKFEQYAMALNRALYIAAGSGGGSGGVGSDGAGADGFAGAGGAGGGAIIIEVWGKLTISGTINCAGANGSNASAPSGGGNYALGGGGGGGGGLILIIYYDDFSDTGTYNVAAGSGGTSVANGAGRTSSSGGVGGAGSTLKLHGASLHL